MASRFFLTVFLMVVFSVSGGGNSVTDNFKWLRNVQQQTVRDYSHGLSAYYENGLWGFVSPGGKVVIAPVFEEVLDFDGTLAIVKQNGKWGVVEHYGKFIHACEYDSISAFEDGVALAEKDGVKLYLYEDGKKKTLPAAYEFHPFSGGFTRIKDVNSGKWGYADAKGVIRINPRYDSATDFNSGLAVVTLGDKAYSINKAGDRKGLSFMPDSSLVVFSNGAGYFKNSAGNLSFFTKGFRVVQGEYSEVNDFSDPIMYETQTIQREYFTSIEQSVNNPAIFAAGGDYWLYPMDEYLWSPDSKTMYDPCPAGWRVAPKSAWEGLTYDCSYSSYGCTLNVGNSQYIWLGHGPYMHSGGDYYENNGNGYIWTSDYYHGSIHGWSLRYGDGWWDLSRDMNATDAYPVRCMKDNHIY